MRLKLFKAAGATALSLCLACGVAAAADIQYKYAESELAISGAAAEGDSFVTLQILKDDMSFGEAYEDENIMLCDQMIPTDGKYKFEIEYNCGSGEYAARVASESGIIETFKIVIVAPENTEAAYNELNKLAENDDFDEFCKLINEKRTELNFGFTLSDGKTLGNELKGFFEYVKENPLKIENESQNASVYKTYITAEALNDGKVESIDGFIESLYFEDKDVLADYLELTETDGMQKYFTEKMSLVDIDDLEAFENAAIKALILTTTRYADGSDDIKNVISEYGSLIGITREPNDSVCRQLIGKDFDDCGKLKDKINELSAGKPSGGIGAGTGSGSGASGGGGGGRTGSFNGEYNIEPIANDGEQETIRMTFEDLDGVMWASEAILALADKGIVNGKGDNMFAPDDNITREEFAKILVGAMKLDNGQPVSDNFTDVALYEWYYRCVNIAKEEGIVKGIGDGMFGVGSPITREDMVVMIYNALNSKNVKMEAVELGFEDAGGISDYAVTPVGALYNMGAVNGVSETAFEPKGLATRAQAAKIIYYVLELLQ